MSAETVWAIGGGRSTLRPLMLIDLFAVLPFYFSWVVPMDLRVLRVLRLFRLLKLVRYSPALQTLGRVIADEYRALLGALLIILVLLLFASTRGLLPRARRATRQIRLDPQRCLVGAGKADHGWVWRHRTGDPARQAARRRRHAAWRRH